MLYVLKRVLLFRISDSANNSACVLLCCGITYKAWYCCMSTAGYQHMLSIVLKKGGIQFLRIMSSTSRLSRFKVPGLLVVGFFVGVAINQLGFVMEGIHVHVELVNSDKTSSPHSTFQDLMQRLPHLNESFASKYVVPNIVHYFWSV